MRWLLRWQHVAPGTQVVGERGTLEVLQQLQGFEIPANAWERQVLARRIADYDPQWLDQLCLTGAVGWGRLSPHPATLDYSGGRPANGNGSTQSAPAPRQRRVIPTSVAPITFFVREDADWMAFAAKIPISRKRPGDMGHPASDEGRGLEPRGADWCWISAAARSFFLCRHCARHGQAEGRDRDCDCGNWLRPVGDGRWIRQSAGADRSQAARGAGKRAQHASAAQFGAVGAAACGCGGRAPAGGRGRLLDAAAALWNCDSRCYWRGSRTCRRGASC
jgi:hypothetical protein